MQWMNVMRNIVKNKNHLECRVKKKNFWKYKTHHHVCLYPCCFTLQGHEMCALLILGEITDSSLINARNNALQM